MSSIESNETIGYDGTGLVPVSALSAGYILEDTFRLHKLLGRGGMGEVWQAYDSIAERSVVLKFVPQQIPPIRGAMDLMKDSFKKIHGLQHQHICPVYALQNDPEYGLYIVMKYIEGISLDEYKRQVRAKYGEMPFAEAVQILWGIARGLDYAHNKKVIHRDIKPQNIMISPKDGVQIIDFGLAAHIRTGLTNVNKVEMEVLGTRPYMSPEQWLGKYQDAKSDQYSLAVTAYELFTGHYPFEGSNAKVLRQRVLNETPDLIANVPDYVNTVLLKALSKKREDRYENCKNFIKALAQGEKKLQHNVVRSEILKIPVILDTSQPNDQKTTTWRPKQSLFKDVKSFFTPKSSAYSSYVNNPEPVIKVTPSQPDRKSDIHDAPSSKPIIIPAITPTVHRRVSMMTVLFQWGIPVFFIIVTLLLLLWVLISIIPSTRRQTTMQYFGKQSSCCLV